LKENAGLGGCDAAGIGTCDGDALNVVLGALPKSGFGASPGGFDAGAPNVKGDDEEAPLAGWIVELDALLVVLAGTPKGEEPFARLPKGDEVCPAGFAAAPKGLAPALDEALGPGPLDPAPLCVMPNWKGLVEVVFDGAFVAPNEFGVNEGAAEG